jgi:cysteine desulfuration protein SufE
MPQAATIAEEQAAIADDFALFDDWREKIEYVLDLGRQLQPLAEDHRIDANKVKGCQSQVWMVAAPDDEAGLLRIHADSDAFIVKGLIALLLRLYDRRRPEDILANPPIVFEQIGLGRHLSPSRANGLHAMVGRIRQIATAAAHGAAAAAPTTGPTCNTKPPRP